MSNFISREAVFELIDNAPIIAGNENESLISAPELLDKICCLPVADVQPVVRGKWIGEDCSYWRNYHSGVQPVRRIRYKCSVCGRTENKKEQFCNCGADMREV